MKRLIPFLLLLSACNHKAPDYFKEEREQLDSARGTLREAYKELDSFYLDLSIYDRMDSLLSLHNYYEIKSHALFLRYVRTHKQNDLDTSNYYGWEGRRFWREYLKELEVLKDRFKHLRKQ